jgi:hypothetical protein
MTCVDTMSPLQAAQILMIRKASRGRPKRVFKALQIQTPKHPDTLVATSPPSPGIDQTTLESGANPMSGGSISPDTLAHHELYQQGVVAPIPASSPISAQNAKLTGLRLRNIPRQSDWELVATEDLLDLAVWFERQVCHCGCFFYMTLIAYIS